MLTPEQLDYINSEIDKGHSIKASYVLALLAERVQLQTAHTAKDRVLSQFADSENWQYEAPAEDESFSLWAWAGDDNPITLANQALMAGHEQ